MFVNQERAVLSTALFLFLVILLLGCQESPKDNLESLANHSLLNHSVQIHTDYFSLNAWGANKHSTHANIYIEGDGQAWEDPWTISNDPSPYDPVSFKLAQGDSRPDSILYLPRPCQFTKDVKCTAFDWTSHRFSHKVIETFQQALNQIKKSWNVKTFSLHAYSGGATVALLIAANRLDVKEVVTFAPLLDHQQWTRYHQYSPLSGSLSPISFANSLKRIPQLHFIGEEDQEVPYEISKEYFAHIPFSIINKIYLVPHYNHHSDWPEFWKSYILNSKETAFNTKR
jgi:hypothetical protein